MKRSEMVEKLHENVGKIIYAYHPSDNWGGGCWAEVREVAEAALKICEDVGMLPPSPGGCCEYAYDCQKHYKWDKEDEVKPDYDSPGLHGYKDDPGKFYK